MAKITREQIQKINSKCKNSWELDIQYFIFHNEKTLKKIIELDNLNNKVIKLKQNIENSKWQADRFMKEIKGVPRLEKSEEKGLSLNWKKVKKNACPQTGKGEEQWVILYIYTYIVSLVY